MINKVLGFLMVMVVLFSSCKKETRDLQTVQDELINEYLKRNKLSFEKDESGIYYEVLREGGDAIKNSDEIFYLQEIKALDGDKIPPFTGLITFSDTYSYNTTRFGYVKVPGFKAGLKNAKLGGKVRAIIPSYLAYGKSGIGTQIKGNQILDVVFDVVNATSRNAAEDSLITRYIKTLPDTDTYTRDESGVYYSIVNAGGTEDITLTSSIKAVYTGKLFNGTQFDFSTEAEPMETTLSSLIEGWKYGVPKIKKGGEIKLLIPSYLAYGASGSGSIPPNTPLFFQIKVLNN